MDKIIRTTHDDYEWNADGSVKGYRGGPENGAYYNTQKRQYELWQDGEMSTFEPEPVQPQRAWSDILSILLLYASAVATGFIIGAVYYGQ